MHSRRYIILGGLMVLLGAVLPFLMMARFIEPSFFLSFISYGASIGGLFLGSYGIVNQMGKHSQEEWYDYES